MTSRRRPAIAIFALAAFGVTTLLGVVGLPRTAEAGLMLPAQDSDSIEDRIRTADNAANSSAEIAAFIDTQVRKLQSDVTAAAAARKHIIQQVSGGTSASFRDEFARLLDERLEPVLKVDNPFLRLNAAIALEGVASATRNPRLIRLTRMMIADASPGVSLWGIKAARSLVGESLQQVVGNETLIPAIVEAVKRHPRSGPLAEAAYRTFQLELLGSNRPDNSVANRGAEPVVIATIDLMKTRLAMYGPGVEDDQNPDQVMPLPPATPPSPLAENSALILLPHQPIWSRLNDQTRAKVVETLRDMLIVLRDANVRALEAEAADPSDERKNLRLGLTGLLKTTSQTLQAIASSGSGAGMQNLVVAARSLSSQPSRIPSDAIIAEVDKVVTAIQAAYPNIPAPPESSPTPDDGGEAMMK